MEDARIGRALRVLRQRRGVRQVDVAAAAGVSQSVVSQVEAGRLSTCSFGTIRRLFAAVDAGFEGDVRWRGAALDRLLDRRHAGLVERSVARLAALGWETVVEMTYSVYGERGSIDVLGARATERAVLVEEVKSDLGSLEATIRKLDEKARLVRNGLGEDRFGWSPRCVGRLLILPETSTSRRQARRYARVLDVAFPDRGLAVRRWLRQTQGELAGILFQPEIGRSDRMSRRGGPERVRVPREALPVP